MRRLTLVNLETLCWIARLGSFTAAAERLNLTQPAISKRIKDLEDAVGVRVFRQQGRRMELTIQGRDLVQRAEPLLNRLEDLVISLENPVAATGLIRMGVGEIVAVTWLARLMAHLKEKMPGVNYEIEVGLTVNMRHKLEVGQLDVAILAAVADSNQITATNLGGVDLHWLIGRKLLAEAEKKCASVKEILESYPIWCVARPSYMYPLAVEMLRKYGVAPKNINTSDSVQSIVELAANDVGIAVLPESMVIQHMKDGRLLSISKELAVERLDFVIARRCDQDQAIIQEIIKCTQEASEFLREQSYGK
ncbi:LysR family transcriptional regulator [Paralcaligenes sp. KSB-10]|uniref:LysR family transcriptional regulator n=1 Tax=Paralcaligenes sp. KSB-10 TaxID=2901142 RepID=UPI001E50DD12|nr:LysR family transcriptional regulator [Paralcaligenes sp. KSB-10]UHL63977.1 LysR family transcriptional regulator [Paralcaligenes sp. KSB-10]